MHPSEVNPPPPPHGTAPALPVVALVGRPNVGKSTLFNRLTRSRQALVADVPGTTRDRREGLVELDEFRFLLVDTGGMGFGADLAFSREVEAQVGEAVRAADFVWVVLDGKEGLNPFDEELHRWVAQQGRPYRLVVNKVDSPGRRNAMVEFYGLGSDDLRAVSAAHGTGLEGLLEETAQVVPAMRQARTESHEAPEAVDPGEDVPRKRRGPGPEDPMRIAFLGRPNVGKSSLVNEVLGRSRMIVADQAGTTREAVETPFELDGQEYVLVDTAGIRRRSKTEEHVEKIGVLHTLGALNWVQVAVLVVDASEDVAAQDARIARYILEHRRAVVVAMNKWDRIPGGERKARDVEELIRERLRFLDFAAFVRTSAVEGSGLGPLFKEARRAAEQFRREIQTADLNRMIQAAVLRFPPPALGHSPTRIYYGAQIGSQPPAFRFFTNHPQRIDDAYTRFFENQLRHHFGLKGTPLRIEWRGKGRDRPPRPAAASRHKKQPGWRP